ncbi:MAG: hypothetical protein ABJH20_14060 [Rhizobiaceae bacterium]
MTEKSRIAIIGHVKMLRSITNVRFGEAAAQHSVVSVNVLCGWALLHKSLRGFTV